MSSFRLLTLAWCATLIMSGQQTVNRLEYEGGSIRVSPHSKVNVSMDAATITLTQEPQRFTIPASSITGIFYGSKVHGRIKTGTGAALLAVNPLAGGVALLHRKGKSLYIGITWTEVEGNKEGGAILKAANKHQCRSLLDSLTAVTGKNAVNTDTATGGK